MIAAREPPYPFETAPYRTSELGARRDTSHVATAQTSRSSAVGRKSTFDEYLSELRASWLLQEVTTRRREIDDLKRKLAVAQYRNRDESEFAATVVDVIRQVVELSQRLFPDGPVSFDYSYDPENPSDQWLTFNVIAKGQYKDYRDREFQWHEEVERIFPGTLTEFRLCVMPQR